MTIAGTILNEAGNGIWKATVSDGIQTVHTDRSGRFTMDTIQPSLTVEAQGYYAEVFPVQFWTGSKVLFRNPEEELPTWNSMPSGWKLLGLLLALVVIVYLMMKK